MECLLFLQDIFMMFPTQHSLDLPAQIRHYILFGTFDVKGRDIMRKFEISGSRFEVQGSRFKVRGSRFKVEHAI